MRILFFHGIGICALLVVAPALSTSCHTFPPSQSNSTLSGQHVVDHAPGKCNLCDLYYTARIHVVRIRTTTSQGAGIVVSRTGEILTSAHVVQGVDQPGIETADGKMFRAEVVRTKGSQDLALLRVHDPLASWVPIEIERTGLPRVGSEVYVIGHPLALGWTVTRGIISAHRMPGEIGQTALLQTDAAISPGNSGGPLLDGKGHLVGLVAAKAVGPGTENVAFAIPASVLLDFLAQPESCPGGESSEGG